MAHDFRRSPSHPVTHHLTFNPQLSTFTRVLIQELLQQPMRTGRLEWIGISPERRGEIRELAEATLVAGTGLEGDHHARSGRSKRQVTLIQAEHLPTIARFLGRDEISPRQLRRNLVVSGLNLIALKERSFRIGDTLLKGTGPCAPCSRMEETLGPGGYNATRGHGGITAIVETGGTIRLGDDVIAIEDS